jgi:hypothetical protein
VPTAIWEKKLNEISQEAFSPFCFAEKTAAQTG